MIFLGPSRNGPMPGSFVVPQIFSGPQMIPAWARFLRIPKSFRTRKAVAKSQTLWLQSCFNYVFLIWPEAATPEWDSIATRDDAPHRHSATRTIVSRDERLPTMTNMKSGSLHTLSFRRIHLSVFRYRLIKNCFAGPKRFWDFRETGPTSHISKAPHRYRRGRGFEFHSSLKFVLASLS